MTSSFISPSKPEGPQIQEEEWEKWRRFLIHLYLEDGEKLKDIVRIMADQHNFVVTERQLKYRFFQKWNAKKNIKSHDLPMLSTAIDKQREVGQDVKIEYHGRNIDRDRVERAFKRYKTGRQPSSQDLPIPSGVSTFLDQRFALASEALGADQRGFSNFSRVSTTGTPLAYKYIAGVGPQAVDDDTRDVVCPMEGVVSNEDLVAGVRSFGPISTQGDTGQSSTRTDHLDPIIQHIGLVGAHSTEAMDLDFTWPIDMYAPPDLNMVPATNSRNAADSAWTVSPEYCLDLQRNGDEMIATMMEHIYLQPHFESPMPTMTPPRFPYSSGVPSNYSTNIMDGLEVDPAACYGTSIDTTLPSLENLLTAFIVLGSDSVLIDVLSDSEDIHAQARDSVPIDHERLKTEIEGLIRWFISSCQRVVVLGQVDRETFDGHALLSIPEQQSNNHSRDFPANQIATRGRSVIEALRFAAQSMFTIELSIAGSRGYSGGSDVITVWSIPYDYRRTTGLRVSFMLNPHLFGCRISPHITTFNVVPFGSSIILCIMQNDLEGVTKIFSEGQASPLDVDPKGNSLLQYAILHGDSAVFRLLLLWGAGVQSSRYPNYEVDFVWTLWTHYVNYVRVLGAPKIGLKRIEDFTECTRMTDLLFESGYDLDEGPYCHPSRPNLLFELAREGNHGRKHRSTIVAALQYLVRKGYDLEERNWEGDTPFLYATMAHSPGAVTRIEAFVEAGSNTSATNFAGQGPLHCALGVPEAVSPADWNIQDSDISWIRGRSFDQYRLVYSTFLDGPEGYRGHANYICWKDPAGVLRRMQNPVEVLKERSKFKILVLLKAGCDPNITDKAGEPPHRYAERNGLFSQWKWALNKNGYMLDKKSGRWVR